MEKPQASLKFMSRLTIPCFCLGFTWLLYGNTLNSSFHFDDFMYIIDAPILRTPGVIYHSLLDNFFLPGRQLTTLSFALNYHLHTLDLAGYHIINICLHGINGYLLFLILQKLLFLIKKSKTTLLSIAATLMFLSHPVTVNSVTYITQRHVLLATLFYLLGYFCFLEWRYSKSTTVYKIIWAISALISYWAAIHSKSMAITLPIICLFTELVFSFDSKTVFKRNLKFSIFFLLAFIGAMFIYAKSRGLFIEEITTTGFRTKNLWSPWVHFLTELIVFIHYWKILLIPWTGWLNVDHHFQLIQNLLEPRLIISILIHLVVLSGAVLAAYKRFVITSIGILWFYVVLSPYLFVPLLDLMVEYKTYPAFPAILLIAIESVVRIKSRKIIFILSSSFLIILSIFCLGTIKRNKVMETEQAFWSDAILKDPLNYRAHNNLGLAYHNKNRPDLALIEYKKALKILPGYIYAISNAGDSLLKVGRNHEALRLYQTVIENNPAKASTYFKAGTACGNLNLWSDALVYFKKAIKLDPYYVSAWYNLGLTKGHLGMWMESKLAFERIIRFKPNHFEAYSNLGVAFLKLGNREEAEKAFQKSITISPSFAEGHYKLSLFYSSEGRPKAAMQELKLLQKLDTTLASQLENIYHNKNTKSQTKK